MYGPPLANLYLAERELSWECEEVCVPAELDIVRDVTEKVSNYQLALWLSEALDKETDASRIIEQTVMMPEPPACESCGEYMPYPHDLTSAMTAYCYEGPEGGPEDPNRPLRLCPFCSNEYAEYWQEKWDEYYRSVL